MNNVAESQHTFKSWDGCELFYRAWQPDQATGKAVVILHRGHEHSGRVTQLFEGLNLPECHGFAYDLRGHGRSQGERGYAESYDVWVRDLNAFINHLRDQHGIAPANMALVANSVGAVNAVTWLHDYGESVRCLVLAAPAFRIRLYIPFALPLLRLLHRVKPGAFITSYVRASMLTHDAKEAAAYDADPLITRKIAVSVLVGLDDASTRVLADAGAITTPTLVLTAGKDYVVDTSAQRQFVEALSSTRKEHVIYPGMYHAIFYETNQPQVLAKAREFIVSCFTSELPRDLLDADKNGYTQREYDRLKGGAPLLKRIAFGLQALGMKTAGRLSKGISIGCRTGFNSGESLDHVYRNKAEGTTVLGRLMDRGYLNAIGWRGIRVRKGLLQHWLQHAAGRLAGEGRAVRILDVASGPGRYLLEFKRDAKGDVALLLRDRDQTNLDAARRLAGEWNLDHIRYAVADAFDRQSYQGLSFSPNIAVASGLYELFPGNDRALASLRGIADALEPGGYLIYTGQPWHPQLEMIARTLTGSDGKPWVMRRRTQAELNALVAKAGFARVDSLVDPYGIFTVSLARKAT